MATKAYDDSPPRNGTIFFYTVLTVFVLIAVKLLLDSYFAKMMDAEVHDKVLSRGMEDVAKMREHEREMLDKTNVEGAMKALSQKTRAALPQIAPKSGRGMQAVSGWTQMKRPVAEAAEVSAPEAAGEGSSDAVPPPAETHGAPH